MASPLVMTFDVGTQSLRALLVEKNGDFLDACSIKYEEPYFSRNNGWAEQRPDFFFEKLCEAARILTGRAKKEDIDRLKAVTITVIRDTAVCLDKNLRPLRDIIMWLDMRQAKEKSFGVKDFVFALVGMGDTAKMQYRASVANWIMQNEPKIWEKTAFYCMLPTYLNYLLTGELTDSYANQIGHIPFDYKNKHWMKKSELTRCFCDIPAEKLCRLVAPGEVIGKITAEASEVSGIPEGLPLIATGSDKGCETLGLSVADNNKAALSFGTTATVQLYTEKYFEPQKFMPAYPAIVSNAWNPEVQIYRGYWLLTWFINQFCAEEREEAKRLGCSVEDVLNAHLGDVPPCCDGLILQPYWSPGIIIPNAKGTITGITDTHTKYHFYRAIIEGVNFALMDGLYSMEKRSKRKITELFVAGGGAQSDAICQITANMFGLPVKRIQTHEVCGLGSSMAAFVAMGEYETYAQAVKSMITVSTVFQPDMKEHGIYASAYSDIYSKIYSRMLPLFLKMKRR